MSSKGNCWDNAPSESFFATLKKELGANFISYEAADFALRRYIDWYNASRRHSFNEGLSSIKKEIVHYTQVVRSLWTRKSDQLHRSPASCLGPRARRLGMVPCRTCGPLSAV
jgi:hypothetical protein